MIGVLAKVIIYGIVVCMIVSVLMHVKLINNNCSCKKRLFGKLVLACDDGKLNTTKTSSDDMKNSIRRK